MTEKGRNYPVSGSAIVLSARNRFRYPLHGIGKCANGDTAILLSSADLRWLDSDANRTPPAAFALGSTDVHEVVPGRYAYGVELIGATLGKKAALYLGTSGSGPFTVTNPNYSRVDVWADGPKNVSWQPNSSYTLNFSETVALPQPTVTGFFGTSLVGGEEGSLTWVYGTPGIVSVDDGRNVRTLACGTTTIAARYSATLPNGTSTTATTGISSVLVRNCPTRVTIEAPRERLMGGQAVQISAAVFDANDVAQPGMAQQVRWTVTPSTAGTLSAGSGASVVLTPHSTAGSVTVSASIGNVSTTRSFDIGRPLFGAYQHRNRDLKINQQCSIAAGAIGGFPPYAFSWSTGATGRVVPYSVTEGGSQLDVTITDAEGNSAIVRGTLGGTSGYWGLECGTPPSIDIQGPSTVGIGATCTWSAVTSGDASFWAWFINGVSVGYMPAASLSYTPPAGTTSFEISAHGYAYEDSDYVVVWSRRIRVGGSGCQS